MNNIHFLKKVVSLLEDNNINTHVCGGWAEELSGLIEPKIHKDIDLLYPSDSFVTVDNLLTNDTRFVEIKEKHFLHKRAFLYKGIMIEILLVQNKNGKLFTNFWGEKIYYWPKDTFKASGKGIRVASTPALTNYRKNHSKLTKKHKINSK